MVCACVCVCGGGGGVVKDFSYKESSFFSFFCGGGGYFTIN